MLNTAVQLKNTGKDGVLQVLNKCFGGLADLRVKYIMVVVMQGNALNAGPLQEKFRENTLMAILGFLHST